MKFTLFNISKDFVSSDMGRMFRSCLKNPALMHAEIQSMFGTSRSTSNVLYRVADSDECVTILVQADEYADPSKSLVFSALPDPEKVDAADYYNGIKDGVRVRFMIDTNPTVKKDGKRVGISTYEERKKWMVKKLESFGLKIADYNESELNGPVVVDKSASMDRKAGKSFKLYWRSFTGTAVVEDANLLLNSLPNGIGHEKAFGHGLLHLY